MKYLILVLLIVLIFLVGCSKAPESYLYNGEFEITPISDDKVTFYQLKLFVNDNPQPYFINVRNKPSSLEDVPIQINKDNLLSKKQAYITINPYENLTSKVTIAALEIDKILDNPLLFNLPINSALTVPYENNNMVKTCNDVNDQEGIIHLKLADKTQIYTENDCIIIEATTEDNLIRAADRFSLTFLGIMQP